MSVRKRIMSVLAVSAVLMCSVSSCSSGKTEETETSVTSEETVEETLPDAHPGSLKAEILGDFRDLQCVAEVESSPWLTYVPLRPSTDTSSPCLWDGKIIFMSRESVEGTSYYWCLNIFDPNTETVRTFRVEFYSVDSFAVPLVLDGQLWIEIYSFDAAESASFRCDIDDNGDWGFTKSDELYGVLGILPESYILFSGRCGNGLFLSVISDETTRMLIWAEDKDNVRHLEITDDISNGFEPSEYYQYGKDRFAVRFENGDTRLIDLNEFTWSSDPVKRYSFNDSGYYSGENGSFYINCFEGIFNIDPDKDSVKKEIDYNTVRGDASVLPGSQYMLDSNGAKWFICSTYDDAEANSGVRNGVGRKMKTMIFKLTDGENPYKDRVLLDLLMKNEDYDLLRNIEAFNLNNDEYYIRYSVADGSVPGSSRVKVLSSKDPAYLAGDTASYRDYVRRCSDLEKLDMEELRSDRNADIICGYASNELVNTSDYFMDLTKFMNEDSSFKKNALYENVVDSAMRMDKLYAMPLYFTLPLIAVEDGYGYYGITQEQDIMNYSVDGKFFLSDYMGYVALGKSFDAFGRAAFSYEVFDQIVENEFDQIIDIDRDICMLGDDFATGAEYAKDHDLERVSDDELFSAEDEQAQVDQFVTYSEIGSIWDIDRDNVVFLPLPSTSGLGIAADITDSAAISVNSDESEGAWEFIRYLISDEARVPVSKSRFSVNRSNNIRMQEVFLSDLGYKKMNDKATDKMNALISSVVRVRRSDAIIRNSYMDDLFSYLKGETGAELFLKQMEADIKGVLN